MYHSKEIRWFFDKENTRLTQWFELRALQLKNAVTRQDYYHIPSLSEFLGIKLREGRLEVKQRTAGSYEENLLSGVKGQIEEWIKWSFKVNEVDEEMEKILSESRSGSWLKVQKARILVKVATNTKGEVQYFGESDKLERGCQLEYSILQVLGKTCYSFGLEWFGKPWFVWDDPNLSDLIGSEFKSAVSQSYPAFLLDHV